MRYHDTLYKAFLEEMNELENFRMSHAAEHPGVSIERDDPDVRRLVEAIAVFAARTRVAGLRNIKALHRRIFFQFFPYLLTPMPPMAVVQATPRNQFADIVKLPAGTEIAIMPEREETGVFVTMADLRITPLKLKSLATVALPGSGYRLLMRMAVPFKRSDDIGKLSFYISHLNDFHASLRLSHLLKKHMKKAFVVFNEKVTELSKGPGCPVSFGMERPGEDEEFSHPLLRERSYFHLPQQELYMNVQVPSPPRNWEEFTICIDLDRNWPKNMTVNETMFQLYAVPVANIVKSMASPIKCDGTKWHHTIRHPSAEGKYELLQVDSVYRVKDGELIPMRAGILSGGFGSYEIEQSVDQNGKRKVSIDLHFPEAFDEPFTVCVGASWFQPWLSDALKQRFTVAPYRRTVASVDFEVVSGPIAHNESDFEENFDAFLHLFTLRSKSRLNLEDLMSLLNALDTVWFSHYKRLKGLFIDLKSKEVSLSKGSGSGLVKLVYTLVMKEYDPVLEPLVLEFVRHLSVVLDAWMAGATVELRTDIAGELSALVEA